MQYNYRNKLALGSRKSPLNHVPPLPEKTRTDVVPYFRPEILDHFRSLPNKTYEDRIAIFTLIRNVDRVLRNYLDNLVKLDYPRRLISVYFGEDGSSDDTFATAAKLSKELTDIFEFNTASVFHFDTSHNVSLKETQLISRHTFQKQLRRRSQMAKSRNLLMKMALNISNPDYIVWIDADLECFPSDLIEQLLYARSDVTAPPCLGVYNGVKKCTTETAGEKHPRLLNLNLCYRNKSLLLRATQNQIEYTSLISKRWAGWFHWTGSAVASLWCGLSITGMDLCFLKTCFNAI
ncbi:MNN9-like protein [Mya arenaria]|uniref:MNN9-like protein n=1 Tax=Mya arenaria TaxID=6604 RepID=A0ABY7DY32_MYAAR|nr:MNN9-like protein [Mya arenaria]